MRRRLNPTQLQMQLDEIMSALSEFQPRGPYDVAGYSEGYDRVGFLFETDMQNFVVWYAYDFETEAYQWYIGHGTLNDRNEIEAFDYQSVSLDLLHEFLLSLSFAASKKRRALLNPSNGHISQRKTLRRKYRNNY